MVMKGENMAKFKKKPVVVDAIQFNGAGDMPEVELFMIDVEDIDSRCQCCGNNKSAHGNVKTLEGFHIACPGDWIITGVQGEHYPCKPSIFAETYEPI